MLPLDPSEGQTYANMQGTIFQYYSLRGLWLKRYGTGPSPVVDISAGYYYAAGLKEDGTLWCWGDNAYGQLGVNDSGAGTDRSTPTAVVGSHESKDIAVGTGGCHTLSLSDDGSLWVWGLNYHGQLGLGTSGGGTNKSTPTLLAGHTFTAVDGGGYHTLGLKVDGSIWSWGYNVDGQLGLGDNTNRSTPTLIEDGYTFTAISTGWAASAALRSDGSIWMWGHNNVGQLGTGDTTDVSVPTQVVGGHSFSSLMCGGVHTFGLRGDGVLLSWGSNSLGQLGLNDTTNRSSPVAVLGGYTFTDFSAGSWHSLGLRDDGAMWAWGRNDQGQLGLGDSGSGTDRSSPVAVVGGHTFTMVMCGRDHSMGISDGGVWSWGNNANGELGVGDTTRRSTPTAVVGLL